MKHFSRFLLCLAIGTGMIAGCDPDIVLVGSHEDLLTVSPSQQKISADGTASFTFTFKLLKPSKNNVKELVDLKETETIATIHFEATGGTVNPASATTDENGNVTVTFTASDLENFTGGTVKGIVKRVKGKVADQQGNLATATATVLPLNAEEPAGEGIKKAEELKDNVYIVQKTGDAAKQYSFYAKESHWFLGNSEENPSEKAIEMQLVDEAPTGQNDEQGNPILSTNGWGHFDLPEAIVGKLQTINKEFLAKYPWFALKFSNYDIHSEKASQIAVNVGYGPQGPYGNMNLNGVSQIWIKERPVKSFVGEYEVLFVFIFRNEEYDSTTGKWVEGDEYTIYGKAVVGHTTPELDYFSLSADKTFVKTGETVNLKASWTNGAEFDWNKVQLTRQNTWSSNEDTWFTFDAANHTLTAIKSADNGTVNLDFAYEGKECTTYLQLETGPGWPYTSFTVEETSLLSQRNKRAGFNVVNWSGKQSEEDSFDYNSLELDYSVTPSNIYYYPTSSPSMRLLIGWGTKVGEHNIRLRLKSHPSYGVTIPIKVTDIIDSFTLSPHEFNLNYGAQAGQTLTVAYEPKDSQWDWDDLELVTEGFIFRPGNQTIAIDQLAPGADHQVASVQVKFRLKSNPDVYDFLNVSKNRQ